MHLAKLLMKFSQAGFPLSKHKLRKLAWQYAEMNGLKWFSQKQKKKLVGNG